MTSPNGRYILEFVRMGNTVKVTACDPETGTEGVIIGPANATKRELSAGAIAKLKYMLDKKS